MARVYLAGAVEKCEDNGIGWRTEINGLLKCAGRVVSPVWPPTLAPGVTASYAKIRADDTLWRRDVVTPDLEALLGCNAVLVRLCPLCGAGTLAEVAVALWARIPVFWWSHGSVSAGIPAAIFDLLLQSKSRESPFLVPSRMFKNPEIAVSAVSLWFSE